VREGVGGGLGEHALSLLRTLHLFTTAAVRATAGGALPVGLALALAAGHVLSVHQALRKLHEVSSLGCKVVHSVAVEHH